MSGVYNHTYFDNRPEEKIRDGVLYGIVLVNRATFERERIGVMLLNAVEVLEDTIFVFKRLGLVHYIMSGRMNSIYTICTSMIDLNQKLSSVDIRSVSKLIH